MTTEYVTDICHIITQYQNVLTKHSTTYTRPQQEHTHEMMNIWIHDNKLGKLKRHEGRHAEEMSSQPNRNIRLKTIII